MHPATALSQSCSCGSSPGGGTACSPPTAVLRHHAVCLVELQQHHRPAKAPRRCRRQRQQAVQVAAPERPWPHGAACAEQLQGRMVARSQHGRVRATCMRQPTCSLARDCWLGCAQRAVAEREGCDGEPGSGDGPAFDLDAAGTRAVLCCCLGGVQGVCWRRGVQPGTAATANGGEQTAALAVGRYAGVCWRWVWCHGPAPRTTASPSNHSS